MPKAHVKFNLSTVLAMITVYLVHRRRCWQARCPNTTSTVATAPAATISPQRLSSFGAWIQSSVSLRQSDSPRFCPRPAHLRVSCSTMTAAPGQVRRWSPEKRKRNKSGDGVLFDYWPLFFFFICLFWFLKMPKMWLVFLLSECTALLSSPCSPPWVRRSRPVLAALLHPSQRQTGPWATYPQRLHPSLGSESPPLGPCTSRAPPRPSRTPRPILAPLRHCG